MASVTKKTAAAKTTEHVDDDGYLCLKGALHWKFQAVESNYVRAQLELKVKTDELNAILAKDDHLREIFAARQALFHEVQKRHKEVLDTQKEIEEALNIKLENCAIDDATGRITELHGTENVPIKAGTGTTPKRRK